MHPILFRFGPVTIYSFGVCIAAAFLVAISTAAARAGRFGWRPDIIYDLCLYVMLAAIAGSRLLYIAENPREFVSSPWDVFKVWNGGLVFYGGLAGAVVAGVLYLKIHRLPVGECFDILIPSVALGHAIGRIGCLLNGCCFGAVCRLPWAVVYPEGSPAYVHHLCETRALAPGAPASLPVHPAQVYDALLELGIFFVLSLLLPRKRFQGQVFWMYFVLYGTGRFLIEFLRADTPVAFRVGGLGLNLAQLASLGCAAAALAVLSALGRRTGKGAA